MIENCFSFSQRAFVLRTIYIDKVNILIKFVLNISFVKQYC